MGIEKEILRNSLQSAPGTMSQLMGMVQSLALVALLTDSAVGRHWRSVVGIIQDPAALAISGDDLLLAHIQFASAFALITITWHVYIQNSIVFKRIYGSFSDSLIPFLIAGVEYWVIELSSPESFTWWERAVAAFVVLAVLSYSHLFTRIGQEFAAENAPILKRLGSYPKWIRAYIAVPFSIVLLDQLVGARILNQTSQYKIVIAFLVFATYPGFIFLHEKYFWNRLIKVIPDDFGEPA